MSALKPDSIEVIQHRDRLNTDKTISSTTIKVGVIIDDEERQFIVLVDREIPIYQSNENGTLHLSDYLYLRKRFADEVKKEYPEKDLSEREDIVEGLMLTIHGTRRRVVNTFIGSGGVYTSIKTKGDYWND